jgi:hypothetical protein
MAIISVSSLPVCVLNKFTDEKYAVGLQPNRLLTTSGPQQRGGDTRTLLALAQGIGSDVTSLATGRLTSSGTVVLQESLGTYGAGDSRPSELEVDSPPPFVTLLSVETSFTRLDRLNINL